MAFLCRCKHIVEMGKKIKPGHALIVIPTWSNKWRTILASLAPLWLPQRQWNTISVVHSWRPLVDQSLCIQWPGMGTKLWLTKYPPWRKFFLVHQWLVNTGKVVNWNNILLIPVLGPWNTNPMPWQWILALLFGRECLCPGAPHVKAGEAVKIPGIQQHIYVDCEEG